MYILMPACFFRISITHNGLAVGMVRKQDGGSNQCISIYTVISSLEDNMLTI